MGDGVFVELEFLLLIAASFILPVSIYAFLMWKQSLSRGTVLMLGVMLVAIGGVNVFLLQRMAILVQATPSLIDDRIFASEVSVALYIFPVLFAGIGVNMISHILISHLADAEKRFDRDQTQFPGSRK